MKKDERFQAMMRDARLGVRRALDEARARASAAEGEGGVRANVAGRTNIVTGTNVGQGGAMRAVSARQVAPSRQGDATGGSSAAER